jgi:hypothetical protein
MNGALTFRAVQHPKLDTLGLVAIRDFMRKWAFVGQNIKEDGVIVTPITMVASIDPELLESYIDVDVIDADSVYDCAEKSVMEFLW